MILRLKKFLLEPIANASNSRVIFWFTLSLTISLIYCLNPLKEAFSSNYIVQDDARQHVFWMQRFVDSELFPNDLIADYFQTMAPDGYKAFYWAMSSIGIHPFLLHKILPPILALITSGYCFGACMQILPVPFAGFLSTLMLNQNLWIKDDIISATPAAFVYPFFMAFLYYLLRRSLWMMAAAIVLLGLFYPQCVFLAAVMLICQIFSRDRSQFFLSRNPQDYWFIGAGLSVAFLVMLPYAITSSEFSPVISESAARELATFQPHHWSNFFAKAFDNYWLCGKRSGFVPTEWCRIFEKYSPFLLPIQCWTALSLPVLLLFSKQIPLRKYVTHKVNVLRDLLIASSGMFLAAHGFLFALHLPNRYTEHSLRMLVAIAGAIALILLLDGILNINLSSKVPASRNSKKADLKNWVSGLGAISTIALFGGILLYPNALRANNYPFPVTGYVAGKVPELYQFLQQQPKDSLIASMTEEGGNIPSFAQRSLLVGGEGYTLPYHPKYYNQMYQRAIDLIQAQYSDDLKKIHQFIDTYKIEFWLIDKNSFSLDYLDQNGWFAEYQPVAEVIRAQLQQGKIPVLSKLTSQCRAWENSNLVLLYAKCIRKAESGL